MSIMVIMLSLSPAFCELEEIFESVKPRDWLLPIFVVMPRPTSPSPSSDTSEVEQEAAETLVCVP